jgi:hypothetical protein
MEIALDSHNLVSSLIGILILIIGWFLRHKDATQETEIAQMKKEHKEEMQKLWDLHHKDASDLKDFQLKVSQEHYTINVIDQKFDRMNSVMERGFEGLGDKLDRLNTVLLGRALDLLEKKEGSQYDQRL